MIPTIKIAYQLLYYGNVSTSIITHWICTPKEYEKIKEKLYKKYNSKYYVLTHREYEV